ncbi:MAG: CopD family protein [Geminicoccaceae bacterium]
MTPLALALHALSAVVWVGGMFFAYVILRPAVGPLPPIDRLPLWRRTFTNFFPWVIAAVALLLITGYLVLFYQFGGFAGAGMHVHVMQLTGWIMFLLFGHLYFVPWKRYQRALDAGDTGAAATQLSSIRKIVMINMILGLVTVAVGSSGRYW